MNTLFEKLDDGRDWIRLYGIAPPKLASTPERLRDIAAEQVDRLRLLAPDDLVILLEPLFFLAFIDSRKRQLSPFISKMWQRCVRRSSKAAVIRSP